MPRHVILICGITVSRDTVECTSVSRLGWSVLSTWSVEGTFGGSPLSGPGEGEEVLAEFTFRLRPEGGQGLYW